MTVDEISKLCEADPELRRWAVRLFGEIGDAAWLPYDAATILSVIRAKVDEFPKRVSQIKAERMVEALGKAR
jgi:hypothetical protein